MTVTGSDVPSGPRMLARSTSGGRSFSRSTEPSVGSMNVVAAPSWVTSATVDSQLFDEEARVDATDVVAFHEIRGVLRIDLARGHRVGVEPGGQRLQRRQVFHLLDADDVGRAHDLPDRQRRLVQSVVERGLRQHDVIDGRIVDGVEEPLGVEAGDGELHSRRESATGIAPWSPDTSGGFSGSGRIV